MAEINSKEPTVNLTATEISRRDSLTNEANLREQRFNKPRQPITNWLRKLVDRGNNEKRIAEAQGKIKGIEQTGKARSETPWPNPPGVEGISTPQARAEFYRLGESYRQEEKQVGVAPGTREDPNRGMFGENPKRTETKPPEAPHSPPPPEAPTQSGQLGTADTLPNAANATASVDTHPNGSSPQAGSQEQTTPQDRQPETKRRGNMTEQLTGIGMVLEYRQMDKEDRKKREEAVSTMRDALDHAAPNAADRQALELARSILSADVKRMEHNISGDEQQVDAMIAQVFSNPQELATHMRTIATRPQAEQEQFQQTMQRVQAYMAEKNSAAAPPPPAKPKPSENGKNDTEPTTTGAEEPASTTITPPPEAQPATRDANRKAYRETILNQAKAVLEEAGLTEDQRRQRLMEIFLQGSESINSHVTDNSERIQLIIEITLALLPLFLQPLGEPAHA